MNSRILVGLFLSLLMATLSAVELSHGIARHTVPVASALHPVPAAESPDPAFRGSAVRPGQAAYLPAARDESTGDSATYSASGQGNFSGNSHLLEGRR